MRQETVKGAPAPLAVAGLLWLALFSLVFSMGTALDLWPPGPDGGFHGIDLVAGLLFGAGLLLSLLRRNRP
jgi:hypothetical protein